MRHAIAITTAFAVGVFPFLAGCGSTTQAASAPTVTVTITKEPQPTPTVTKTKPGPTVTKTKPGPTVTVTKTKSTQTFSTPEEDPGQGYGGGGGNCDPNYEGACVPVVSDDLNCADIGQSVRVVGVDRHGSIVTVTATAASPTDDRVQGLGRGLLGPRPVPVSSADVSSLVSPPSHAALSRLYPIQGRRGGHMLCASASSCSSPTPRSHLAASGCHIGCRAEGSST